MTAQDDGWLRRWVGGRRRDEASEPVELPSQEELLARLRSAVDDNHRLNLAHENQKRRIADLESRLQDSVVHERQAGVLNAELKTQQRSTRAALAAAEQTRRQKDVLLRKVEALQHELREASERAQANEASLANLSTRLGPLREQARRTQKELAFYREQLDEERTVRKDAQERLQGHKDRVDELERELATARATTEAVDARHRRQLQRVFGRDGGALIESLPDRPDSP